MKPNKGRHIQNIPLHRTIVGDTVQAVCHEWMAIAGEQIVKLVLKAPHAWLKSIIPWYRSSNFWVIVRPLTYMSRKISRKAALVMNETLSLSWNIYKFKQFNWKIMPDYSFSRFCQKKA